MSVQPGLPTPLLSRLLDRAESALETYLARLILSSLILLSLLPVADILKRFIGGGGSPLAPEVVDLVFFAFFFPEFLVRLAVHVRRRRVMRVPASETWLLILDFLATLSFLPLWNFLFSLSALRLARLVRMVVLLGYWGGMIGDLIKVMTARERRGQVAFVLILAGMLSFAGGIVLHDLKLNVGTDGTVQAGKGPFERGLWWSFRQVQDPGNLVQGLGDWVVVLISVFLTFAGLMLLSFFIGIGTGAIDELMQRSRVRPTGMRNHSVILGLGPHTHFLLTEFVELYAKNRRTFKAVVMGSTAEPPGHLSEDLLRWYQYRPGNPVQVEDLTRVDVARARRVLILGTDDKDPDAEVISAILATRDRNPTVDLFPALDHAANLNAARTAGGPRTHIIGSGSFLGDYVAQNVIFPGAYRIYRQLLTSAGCEIYTYIYTPADRAALARSHVELGTIDPLALYQKAFQDHGVTLLGLFVAPCDANDLEAEDLEVAFLPIDRDHLTYAFDEAGRVRTECLRGLIGITLRWEDLHLSALEVVDNGAGLPALAAAELPALPRLELPATVTRRVLICGGSERVPRVILELLKFYGALEVTVIVREEDRVATLVEALETAVERRPLWPSHLEEDPVIAEPHGNGTLVRIRMPGGEGLVHVIQADWTDTTRIVHQSDVDVSTTDALLFMPSKEVSDEADGLVALDCLQLSHLLREGKVDFPESFRVVGMVNDPIKGDLLENRLDAMAKARPRTTFTIVCGERIRHYFTVQSVFVRGLSKICLDLLDASRQGLCRVLPSAADGGPLSGPLRPWDLARSLLRERRLVLLGIERDGPDGRAEVLLDPTELATTTDLDWAEVKALYVLGDARPLLHPPG